MMAPFRASFTSSARLWVAFALGFQVVSGEFQNDGACDVTSGPGTPCSDGALLLMHSRFEHIPGQQGVALQQTGSPLSLQKKLAAPQTEQGISESHQDPMSGQDFYIQCQAEAEYLLSEFWGLELEANWFEQVSEDLQSKINVSLTQLGDMDSASLASLKGAVKQWVQELMRTSLSSLYEVYLGVQGEIPNLSQLVQQSLTSLGVNSSDATGLIDAGVAHMSEIAMALIERDFNASDGNISFVSSIFQEEGIDIQTSETVGKLVEAVREFGHQVLQESLGEEFAELVQQSIISQLEQQSQDNMEPVNTALVGTLRSLLTIHAAAKKGDEE